MANLTKKDIILSIHDRTGIGQNDVRDIVQMTLDSILNALGQGNSVELRSFGVFSIQKRKSRIGRNPNKPDQNILIPARAAIKFKPGKALKGLLKDINPKNLDR